MRNIKYIFLFSSMLLLLVGCYDRKEVEQQSYVVALGLDKSQEEGIYDITFQIANPEVGTTASGGGSKEEPKETVTLKATDFVTAQNTANSFVSREISLDFARVLVISEELARSNEFLKIMETASRAKDLRNNVSIIVSKERASEFLSNVNPKMETRPHKYFQFMIERARETGIIPEADIHRFFQITEGDADLFLAMYATSKEIESNIRNEDEYVAGEVPQKGGSMIEFMGSAVFKEGKMIDILSGEETRTCITLDNTREMEDVLVTYKDPLNEKYRIAARFIKKKNTEIKVNYFESQPTEIKVKVPFTIEILAVPSLAEYSTNKENQELLKKTIESDLKNRYEELIAKTQEIYRAEPFYWSIYVRKYFTSIKEFENADWNKKIYPNARIHVQVDMEKMKFGQVIKSTNFSEVQD